MGDVALVAEPGARGARTVVPDPDPDGLPDLTADVTAGDGDEGGDDDGTRSRGPRRPPGWRTVAGFAAAALALGAVAGWTQAQRVAERSALEGTTLLAWTTGFDGAGWDGDDEPLRLQVRLVALTGRSVTVTGLGDGSTLRLREPVELRPGYPAAVVVQASVRCTTDGSLLAGTPTADVRSESGLEATVPVRVVSRGLEDVVADACSTRVVEPARVVSMDALPEGAVEVSLRAADGVAPSYLTVDVDPSRSASWQVAVDPQGAIALVPGRTQTYRFTLEYLRCTPGGPSVRRPPMMPDTSRVLTTSVVTGFTGTPRELAGWDDDVVSRAAVAAVARACA